MIILLAVSAAIYLLFQICLAIGWWQAATFNPTTTAKLHLSVIVAAHNEYENLQKFLPALLRQTYDSYEICIVLDRCSDKSAKLLQRFQNQNPRLTWIEIHETPEGWASKKWAVTTGVSHARYEHLVFTDADCQVGPEWLSTIAAHFQNNTEVILGVGMYFRFPGLLNLLIRFETFYTAFQYIGLAKWGLPYMGVGRNLAYTRSFFERHQGLSAFRERLSGDDDLLINAYAKARHTRVMVSRKSYSFSVPATSWKSWLRQKFRHLSASPAYSVMSKTILSIFHLSHMCFYAGLLVSLTVDLTNTTVFSLYITRITLSWVIFVSVNYTIREEKLVYAYTLLDLLYALYNLIVVPVGLIKQPEWKK